MLGNCLRKPVYYYSYSTNMEEYQKFIIKVKNALIDKSKKVILYYDGHRAHTGASVAFVSQYFHPLQSVPYSSNFNRT